MNTPYFIEKIDWSELRNQKNALIEVMNTVVTVEEGQYLEGILGLIDAVQDYAVDEMGLNPTDIYDFEQEDRDEESKEERFAREQAESIFQMHIEGSFIYENEVMSEEFIESILDHSFHATAIKNVMRHAILEDIQNGTITSLEYNIEMYDYGHLIEDYCMEQFYKDKTKTLWVCSICGSDNVQFKTWTDANSFQATNDECPMEDQDCHCKDCESNATLIHKEMPFLNKFIGFQVVSDGLIANNDGELHPAMIDNENVFSLSQAREMINGDCSWKLVTVWSKDIEEPKLMFEGNPRD